MRKIYTIIDDRVVERVLIKETRHYRTFQEQNFLAPGTFTLREKKAFWQEYHDTQEEAKKALILRLAGKLFQAESKVARLKLALKKLGQ